MIEIVEEKQERREVQTLEEYVEQMEESEKRRLFDSVSDALNDLKKLKQSGSVINYYKIQ